MLCVGTEKGVVEIYRITLGEEEESEEEEDDDEDIEKDTKSKGAELERIATLVGHTNRYAYVLYYCKGLAKKSCRVKAISSLPFLAPTSTGDVRKTIILTTVSSDGLINVYDLCAATADSEKGEENKVEPVASYDTKGTRLTCVYLADGQDGTKEIKVKEEEVSESEDGGEDIYGSEQASDDDDDDDGMEVEFEDEEEEEIEGEEE